jgi:hypothetical protein
LNAIKVAFKAILSLKATTSSQPIEGPLAVRYQTVELPSEGENGDDAANLVRLTLVG